MSFVRGRGRGRGYFKSADTHCRKFNTKSVNQNHAASGSMVHTTSESTQVLNGLVAVENSANISLIKINLVLDSDSEEWFLRLRSLWNMCKCMIKSAETYLNSMYCSEEGPTGVQYVTPTF